MYAEVLISTFSSPKFDDAEVLVRIHPPHSPNEQSAPPFLKASTMNISAAVLLGMTAIALAACGTGTRDRVQGGAAAGAASGATVGLVGGPVGVAAGAVIGGGAGALTGASTTPTQVDLGKPVWKK